MEAWRSFLGFLAALALLAGVPGAGVLAQTEVDRAADDVTRAEAEKAEAEHLVDAWAATRRTVQAQVMAALFSLEQTNSQLEQTSFQLLDLRDEIFDTEARIRHLRIVTETRAVEAYMEGTAAGLISIWPASTFEQRALLEETVASTKRADAQELAKLATEKDRLAGLQEGYEKAQDQLRSLRAEAEIQSRALQGLFDEVDAGYATSYRGLEAADAAYRREVSEWEEARRRRAARAGVEPWRTLVQQYFPENLVDQALSVMRCESGGDPDAVHPESGATGLFQFLAGTWAFSSVNAGFPGASRLDAEANIASAAWLADHSSASGHPQGAWGHWVCRP